MPKIEVNDILTEQFVAINETKRRLNSHIDFCDKHGMKKELSYLDDAVTALGNVEDSLINSMGMDVAAEVVALNDKKVISMEEVLKDFDPKEVAKWLSGITKKN